MQFNYWPEKRAKLERDMVQQYCAKQKRSPKFIEQHFEEFVTSLAAYEWLRAGQPYYKLWPPFDQWFATQDFTDITIDLLELPYTTFTVCFAKGQGKLNESVNIKSMMISNFAYCFEVQVIVDKKGEEEIWSKSIIPRNQIELAPNTTLMDVIAEDKNPLTYKEHEKVLKIAASVTLIATGADKELLSFDILSKYREPYKHANKIHRKNLEKKSIKRGHFGWNIKYPDGERELFKKMTEQHNINNKTELTFCHLRAGHFHRYWTGYASMTLATKYIRPVLVRPDLPVSPGQPTLEKNMV